MADEQDGLESGGFTVGGPLAKRIQALGPDAAVADAASWRVRADMDAMLTRFGLDPTQTRDMAALEIMAAEACCASCREADRCHGYLGGAPDRPQAFCPNAATFDELARER
jgi:hypothetical protein